MDKSLEFPTKAQVDNADIEQLAYWYRFLLAKDSEQQVVLNKISERFKKLGGMTKALSRRIGHGGVEKSRT